MARKPKKTGPGSPRTGAGKSKLDTPYSRLGNSAKDSIYLKLIKNATEEKSHPRHQGIRMQAHHIISAEGVKKSGLGKQLVQYGYDINLLPNLVYIPTTLQGACHLGVQPHRGNHTAPVDEDAADKDSERPDGYHDLVKMRVKELKRILTDGCPATHPGRRAEICRKMDHISEKIVGLIQNVPGSAPLTTIARDFSPNHLIGCGCVDSVGEHRLKAKPCAVDRNHENRAAPGQKAESITFKKTAYKLKPGQ
jgi:hypothetical protein